MNNPQVCLDCNRVMRACDKSMWICVSCGKTQISAGSESLFMLAQEERESVEQNEREKLRGKLVCR